MERNIEIKARLGNIAVVYSRVSTFADSGPIVVMQDDTFFACKNGRLKLRTLSPTEGELIFYRRDDKSGPKESFYLISPITTPDIVRKSLSLAYGQVGRVVKTRTLFLVGRTRIHLDRVKGLGNFLELEVVLFEREHQETGEEIAKDLMKRLGVIPNQLIKGAYIDLLRKKLTKKRISTIEFKATQ